MVDIHSHILYGLDDGARTLEESVSMMKAALRGGTTDIVASPHSNLEFSFDPDSVASRIREVAEACGGTPRLHRGCDFHLTYDNIQRAIADPARYTINGKGYLLVEFPDLLIFKNSDEIFELLLGAGMIPIITHPERNWLLQQRMKELEAWAAKGVLVQVTAHSYLGRFGNQAREFAELLMRRRLVHFIASDAHDPEDRSPDLSRAYGHIARKYGDGVAGRLFVENPGRVLNGEPLDLPEAETPAAVRKWYQFWK
ncbi:MAG: hypothetical protein KIT09_17605 [Bryobacteraceae bacterium]|nr:hypothetical protein [Bryobacteraceae bacterium]